MLNAPSGYRTQPSRTPMTPYSVKAYHAVRFAHRPSARPSTGSGRSPLTGPLRAATPMTMAPFRSQHCLPSGLIVLTFHLPYQVRLPASLQLLVATRQSMRMHRLWLRRRAPTQPCRCSSRLKRRMTRLASLLWALTTSQRRLQSQPRPLLLRTPLLDPRWHCPWRLDLDPVAHTGRIRSAGLGTSFGADDAEGTPPYDWASAS